MADNEREGLTNFNPADVSKPVTPRKEVEIMAEEKAAYRREWIRSHLTLIFIIIGIIVVVLTFVAIHFYNQSSGIVSRFMSSSSKDFGTPFDFTAEISKDGETVMSYSGCIDVNSRKHTVRAAYDADYGDYTYKGIVYSDDTSAVKGYYYGDKWTVSDCTAQIADFFDFDRNYRRGTFSTGAFLRFTGLTSVYSKEELRKFIPLIKDRLSTDTSLAEVTVENGSSGTVYRCDINVEAFFELIKNEGASIFRNADDFNSFTERCRMNEANIRNSSCKTAFTVDPHGYMTDFSIEIKSPEHSFGFKCKMSNFNMAVTQIPAEFLEKATVSPSE